MTKIQQKVSALISGEIIITKNVTTGTGSGTKDDPYIVTTYAELRNLMENTAYL